MSDASRQIIEGALSDDAAVAELLRRQKVFAADIELPPELQARGQSHFNTALYPETPATLQEGKAVFTILRRTIKAIGSFYLEHEQLQRDIQSTDDTSGEAMNGVAQMTEFEAKDNGATDNSTQYHNSDELSQNPRVQPAIAARRRRRALTHGCAPSKGMSAAAGVLKTLRRATQTANVMFSGLVNTTGRNDASANKAQHESSTVCTCTRHVCSSLSPHQANNA
jgi:hypothetical protein